MPSPSEKLATSLELLQELQRQGRTAIRTSDLSRVHRERLRNNGFLQEVMKGWYMPMRPDQVSGESTAWFASFWAFCADYFRDRFGDDWCLSPEQSLSLHIGNRTVPRQLIVRSPKGLNNVTHLPHDTSVLDYKLALPTAPDIDELDGLKVYTLPAALTAIAPAFFRNNPIDTRAALTAISDASELLNRLLAGGHTVVAGRLAGAFANIGRERIADQILKTMRSAGFDSRQEDPFAMPSPFSFNRSERSPYVSRMRLMWHTMRGPVIQSFPNSLGLPKQADAYLTQVQEIYTTDAYHSLSIEGFIVSKDLIDKVRQGNWNPDADKADRNQRDTLAARGYWQSYQAVRKSLARALTGENAGIVADDDHAEWYRELLAPSVSAGLLRPVDLAGYRNDQVFIRHSMHVPPDKAVVRDAMPALFELLRDEQEPGVRAVLGHFFFVYIHPYMDGNGRIGRFLMNVMLASGGYPWTVIPLDRRNEYMKAFESASLQNNIEPWAKLLAQLVDKTIAGQPEGF
ncbi:MAG: Fic family protein [Candidatus Melainabacteria bacterium]|nr:Fic family protein [Candidatus Melainabacteria bacterium]